MRKQAGGFTLIELVMVIVILGLLAATALPKFIDLTTQAEQAAVAGVAGGLGAASAINKAGSLAGVTVGVITINGCEDVASALDGGLDTNVYTIATAATSIAVGATALCTVSSANESATFVAHGV